MPRAVARWLAFALGTGTAAGLVWLGSVLHPQPHARPEPAAANPLPEKPRTASGIAQVFAQPPAPEPADYERLVIVADLENIVRERSPAPERAHEIAEAIYRHARRYGLDPYLVLAVAEVESGLDPFAVSVAGARGLMQVMPLWKARVGRPQDNLLDIDTNVRYGCAILRFYLDRTGNLTKALAAYNGSAGRVKYPLKVYAVLKRYRAPH